MVGPTQFTFATLGVQLAWRLKTEYGKLPGRGGHHRHRGRALAGGCRVQEKAHSPEDSSNCAWEVDGGLPLVDCCVYGRVERT